jgi:putative DNA primase/helicase
MNDPKILAKLQDVTRTSRGWTARCPAHDDEKPSLSISVGEDGRVLVHCFAGCTPEQVVAAVGMGMADLGPAMNIVAAYDYRDEHGTVLFQAVRLSPKSFRLRRLNAKGDWVWKMDGVRRVPYRLPELQGQHLALLVEGEKDADNVAALGLPATTTPQGAAAWRDEYADVLRGCGVEEVVVIPDNDEPGRRYAVQAGTALTALGITVRVLALPGLAEKGDVSDWIAAGGTAEALKSLVDEAPTFGVGELPALADTTAWPDPQPVDDAILPVPAFDPMQMLPEPFAAWVVDVADRAQCPPDFVAIPLLCALAAVVGRKVAIRPKRHDDWAVVPNLWGVIVGEPGVMKTPAMQEAVKVLKRLEAEAREDFAARAAAHETQMELYEAQLKAWKDALKKATANHEPTDDLMASQPVEPEEPVARRYIVNDTTVEKIGELLNQNPNGLLIFRDEMIGFLRSMDRDGHENDRSFYNIAWEGNQSYTYDRIGRGTVVIDHACVSLVGGIQPGPLREYLNEVIGGGGLDDGFIQRLQLMVWPTVNRAWQNADRWPDTGAKNRVYEVFRRLDQLSAPDMIGARVEPEAPDSPPFLQFTPEAQGVFDAWRTKLERRCRADGAEHPALVNHLSKYRSLMPSLALLLHLPNPEPWSPEGPPHRQVSESAARRAVAWCEYLEAHAQRVYQSVTRRTEAGASRLAQHINRGRLKDPFTVYQVKRQGWGGLGENKDIIEALTLLEERGWVRAAARPSSAYGGKPTVEYHVNPKVGLQR